MRLRIKNSNQDRGTLRKVLLLFFALDAYSTTLAQSPETLLKVAFTKREAVKSAETQLESTKSLAGSLAAYPLTRLETGSDLKSDVTGGEDLTLFQPIDIFGKARLAGKSANILVRISEANLRQIKLNVQSEVLGAYAMWASAFRNQRFALNQLEVVRKVELATRTRVEARALPELQNVRASLEVQRAEQILIDRDAALQLAKVKLRQSVGFEITDLGKTEPEHLTPSLLNPSNVEGNRPELTILTFQKQAALFDAEQARLSRLPDLELQARRSQWSSGTEQYGVRIQLVFPLWDYGSARKKAEALNRQSQAFSLNYTDMLKRIQAEVESSRIQLVSSQKSLLAYSKLLDGAQELLRRTQRGFELGANSLLDVLEAKRTLDEALEQSSNAMQNTDLAIVAALAAQGQIIGEHP
jgi:outer membrane protein TolC